MCIIYIYINEIKCIIHHNPTFDHGHGDWLSTMATH